MAEKGSSANTNCPATFDTVRYFKKVGREQDRIGCLFPKSLHPMDTVRTDKGIGGGVMSTKELIEYIAKALVDHPDQVRVSEIEGERTSVIELSVAKEDLGKVIGKQGRTARAIRVILGAVSANLGKHSVLEIIE